MDVINLLLDAEMCNVRSPTIKHIVPMVSTALRILLYAGTLGLLKREHVTHIAFTPTSELCVGVHR